MFFQRLKCGACLGTQMRVQICGPVFGFQFWYPFLGLIFGSIIAVYFWNPFLGSIFGVQFWGSFFRSIFYFFFGIPFLGSIFGDHFWVQILDFGVQFLDPNLDPFLGSRILILLFFNRGPFLGSIFGVQPCAQCFSWAQRSQIARAEIKIDRATRTSRPKRAPEIAPETRARNERPKRAPETTRPK